MGLGNITCCHNYAIFGQIPYFFDYKTGFFSFQNNPKDLDPSCKTDLDLWDCLGKGKNWYYSKIS